MLEKYREIKMSRKFDAAKISCNKVCEFIHTLNLKYNRRINRILFVIFCIVLNFKNHPVLLVADLLLPHCNTVFFFLLLHMAVTILIVFLSLDYL